MLSGYAVRALAPPLDGPGESLGAPLAFSAQCLIRETVQLFNGQPMAPFVTPHSHPVWAPACGWRVGQGVHVERMLKVGEMARVGTDTSDMSPMAGAGCCRAAWRQ